MRRATPIGLALLLGGCDLGAITGGVRGDGVRKSETRQVAAFDQVAVLGGGTVELLIGPAGPLEITMDQNLLPLIRTEVKDGRLVIEPTEPIRSRQGFAIRVATPDVRRIESTGAARITVTGVSNARLELQLSGAGSVTASGRTDALVANGTGAVRIMADGLEARQVDIDLTGACHGEVHATEALDAAITGAGSVVYRGDPKVTQRLTGAGSVKKRD